MIKKNFISNRKLILELRYDSVSSIIDKRGEISDKLLEIDQLNAKSWKISVDTVEVFDSEYQDEITKRVFVGINRLSFIDECALNEDSFLETFEKVFAVFNSVLKRPKIRRVGCRIMGSYVPQSGSPDGTVSKFVKVFTNEALIEDFPVRDASLTITYPSGRYKIGPIRKDDPWIAQNFKHKKSISKGGFAIDTDNYVINKAGDKAVSESEIRNIYDTSLDIESNLYQKLSDIYGQ